MKYIKSLHEADKRIPRKKGQKAKSDKHSDLYTDEDPKGTIHGLGFKDAQKAEDGIRDSVASRGLGDVYKRQCGCSPIPAAFLTYTSRVAIASSFSAWKCALSASTFKLILILI